MGNLIRGLCQVQKTESQEEMVPIVRNETEKSPRNKVIGIMLATLSALFFTLRNVLAKLLKRIDPFEVTLFSTSICAILTLPLLFFTKANPLGPKDGRLLLCFLGKKIAISYFVQCELCYRNYCWIWNGLSSD